MLSNFFLTGQQESIIIENTKRTKERRLNTHADFQINYLLQVITNITHTKKRNKPLHNLYLVYHVRDLAIIKITRPEAGYINNLNANIYTGYFRHESK